MKNHANIRWPDFIHTSVKIDIFSVYFHVLTYLSIFICNLYIYLNFGIVDWGSIYSIWNKLLLYLYM